MAIFHAHAKIFSRSNGVSILARASYRSGEILTSHETGLSFDFSRKGGVVFSNILLPDNAPESYLDRETLWNAVESVETQSNAQLAREFECAIPREIPESEREKFVTNFIQNTFVSKGMCADYSIHNPSKREPNPHVHILLTMRPIKENGEWGEKYKNGYVFDENGNKIPELDDKGNQKIGARGRKMWKRAKVPSTNWNEVDTLNSWRKAWEVACNSMLAKEDQISCESNLSRGIDLLPTKHEGLEGKFHEENSSIKLDRHVVKFNHEIRAYNYQFYIQSSISQVNIHLEPFKSCYPQSFEESYPNEYKSENYRFNQIPRSENETKSELLSKMPECDHIQDINLNNVSLHFPSSLNVFSNYKRTTCGCQCKSTSLAVQQFSRTASTITTRNARELTSIPCFTVKFPKIKWQKLIPIFNLKFPRINFVKWIRGNLEKADVATATTPYMEEKHVISDVIFEQHQSDPRKVYRFEFNGSPCEASASEIRENVDSGYFNKEEFERVLSPEDYREIFGLEDRNSIVVKRTQNEKRNRSLR